MKDNADRRVLHPPLSEAIGASLSPPRGRAAAVPQEAPAMMLRLLGVSTGLAVITFWSLQQTQFSKRLDNQSDWRRRAALHRFALTAASPRLVSVSFLGQKNPPVITFAFASGRVPFSGSTKRQKGISPQEKAGFGSLEKAEV